MRIIVCSVLPHILATNIDIALLVIENHSSCSSSDKHSSGPTSAYWQSLFMPCQCLLAIFLLAISALTITLLTSPLLIGNHLFGPISAYQQLFLSPTKFEITSFFFLSKYWYVSALNTIWNCNLFLDKLFSLFFFSKLKHMHPSAPPPTHTQINVHPLDGIFYIMLPECVHSGGISYMYMQGSMYLVDLHYNCLGSCMVSWGLCYNSIITNVILISYKINYEMVFITLKMLYCDGHVSIHIIILALRHSCSSMLVLGITLVILTNIPIPLLSLLIYQYP